MYQAARRAALALASAALHSRHQATAEHSDDVVELSAAIGDELGIAGAARERLLTGAELHDVGKLAMPHDILEKQAPLDETEWELMRQHTVAGERILLDVPELADVATVVRAAHERWDGGGYPDGLAGEAIPLESRVIFCADAYHAIPSDRPYRKGRPAAEALVEIRAHAGTQFDPRVVDALMSVAAHARADMPWRGRLSPRAMVLLLTLGLAATGFAASPTLRHAFGLGGDDHPPAPVTAPVVRPVAPPVPKAVAPVASATAAPTPTPVRRSRSVKPAAKVVHRRHVVAAVPRRPVKTRITPMITPMGVAPPKPEASVPAKPEASVPAKPEASVPTKPEASVPAKPEHGKAHHARCNAHDAHGKARDAHGKAHHAHGKAHDAHGKAHDGRCKARGVHGNSGDEHGNSHGH